MNATKPLPFLLIVAVMLLLKRRRKALHPPDTRTVLSMTPSPDTTPLPDDINPGILTTVQWLRSHGFHTVDSGDGKTHDCECDLPVPYVHMRVAAENMVAECRRLARLLGSEWIAVQPMDAENSVPCLQCSWDVADGEGMGIISLYNVTIQPLGEEPPATPSAPSIAMDDDLDGEVLGPACSRDDPGCESCQ